MNDPAIQQRTHETHESQQYRIKKSFPHLHGGNTFCSLAEGSSYPAGRSRVTRPPPTWSRAGPLLQFPAPPLLTNESD